MEGKRIGVNFLKEYLQNRRKINLIMIVIILIYYFFSIIFFKEILYGENIIFPYALNKFYIDIEYPKLWKKIKLYFFIINILTPVTILLIYNFKKYNIWKKLYIKGLDKNKGRDFIGP